MHGRFELDFRRAKYSFGGCQSGGQFGRLRRSRVASNSGYVPHIHQAARAQQLLYPRPFGYGCASQDPLLTTDVYSRSALSLRGALSERYAQNSKRIRDTGLRASSRLFPIADFEFQND